MSDTGTCGAKTRTGSPCKRPAGYGTSHVGTGRCKSHGGATPTHELAGQVELARREAQTMGQPLDIDPGEALLQCIRIAAGEVQYASQKVAELPDAMVSTMWGPKLHAWAVARQHAMDRLVTYSSVAIKAGLEERRVQLAEQQGDLIAEVIRGVLTDLGVQDRPEAPSIVRRHLELVAGRAA